MVNATKLNENLRYITDNQDGWKQETWAESITTTGDVPPTPGACGTSFCLAGWAVVNDGHKLNWTKSARYNPSTGKDEYVWSAATTEDGREISELAQEILGLPDKEMFAGGNSLVRLWDMAEGLSPKIRRPDSVPAGRGTNDYEDDCDCPSCEDERRRSSW